MTPLAAALLKEANSLPKPPDGSYHETIKLLSRAGLMIDKQAKQIRDLKRTPGLKTIPHRGKVT